MLYSFMKIHTLSLWVLRASDGHFIHTFLFICFPSNCLHSTPFLPPIFSGSFHLSFLFGNQSYCTRVVSFSSSTSKCLRFSSKGGGLGFPESNTSTLSPNLSPCLPQDQSFFFSWAHVFSCIFNLPHSTSSVYRHIYFFLFPPYHSFHLITFPSLPRVLTTCFCLLTFYLRLAQWSGGAIPSTLLRFAHPLLEAYGAVAQTLLS